MPTAIDVVWPVSAGGALVDDTLPISDDASVFVLSGADMVRLTERDEDPAVELLGPVLISVCSGTLEIVGAVVESVFAMKEPVRMLWEGMLNEGELYDKTTLLVLRLVVEGTEGRAVDSTVGKISVEEEMYESTVDEVSSEATEIFFKLLEVVERVTVGAGP